jgi:hypothetical protein
MVICNSLLLLKSLPINIINCIKFYVNCSALTGVYDWQYKYLFVCLYTNHPIRNPDINRFTNHFLFIHNHLTLSKWCYTPLQHDFALDPMIPPFVFHFSNICHVTTRKPRLPQCIMGDDLYINKQTNIFIANHRCLLRQNN